MASHQKNIANFQKSYTPSNKKNKQSLLNYLRSAGPTWKLPIASNCIQLKIQVLDSKTHIELQESIERFAIQIRLKSIFRELWQTLSRYSQLLRSLRCIDKAISSQPVTHCERKLLEIGVLSVPSTNIVNSWVKNGQRTVWPQNSLVASKSVEVRRSIWTRKFRGNFRRFQLENLSFSTNFQLQNTQINF